MKTTDLKYGDVVTLNAFNGQYFYLVKVERVDKDGGIRAIEYTCKWKGKWARPPEKGGSFDKVKNIKLLKRKTLFSK